MQVDKHELEISTNILSKFNKFVIRSVSNYYLYVDQKRTDKILRNKSRSRCSK